MMHLSNIIISRSFGFFHAIEVFSLKILVSTSFIYLFSVYTSYCLPIYYHFRLLDYLFSDSNIIYTKK